ncbi:MAG: acylneuraminate cytidylyltransferase family protein [Minwuia sp.]|nr:acylneuraminate cytidylyltransferase family protein [Minwuia sp.]
MSSNQHRALGVICARGGSRGLPDKNILDLGGRPLIAWTVEAARNAARLDRTIVSTDSTRIADAARAHGAEVPFLRPSELASDTAKVTDALVHAAASVSGSFDIIVLLQATSPFRTGEDIDATIDALIRSGAQSAVTFTEQGKSPDTFVTLRSDNRVVPLSPEGLLKRRQDQRILYAPNGVCYAVRTEYLLETGRVYGDDTVAVIIPAERALDIDTPYDMQIARGLIAVSDEI